MFEVHLQLHVQSLKFNLVVWRMSIKPGAWAFNYIFLEKMNSDN